MDIQSLFTYFTNELLSVYHSTAFSIFEFIMGIYVIVLVVDIILLLIVRDVGASWREAYVGMNIPTELTKKSKKNKLKADWEKIKQRLESGNESEYKVAIIEADNLIDGLVARMGYKGENFGARLDSIPPGQIENIEELKRAHEVRNRIIHDENFAMTKEEAGDVLGVFEKFLHYFEVLS